MAKKSELQQLGTDVEFFTKKIDKQDEESRLIKRLGETRCPENQEYVGTVMVHYYLDKTAILKNRYDVSTMQYINFLKPLSENVGALGMNNAVIALRKYFNETFRHKSTNTKDKRNDIIT
jgi:hypothetical protein